MDALVNLWCSVHGDARERELRDVLKTLTALPIKDEDRSFVCYQQFLDNLSADNHLDDQKKIDIMAHLLDNKGALSRDLLEKHCRCHQQQGPDLPDRHLATFGHAVSIAKLRKLLKRGRFDPRKDHIWHDLIGMDLVDQREALRGIKLGRYLFWGFFQNHAKDQPFDRVAKESPELRRRLGLGHTNDATRFACFAYRVPADMSAAKPTTLDAELSPWFRPGGTSFPLDGAADGLPETVHDPIDGSQLATKIEEAV